MSKIEKLPIFYFDKYGNATEKPVVKKPIPAGVTAQSVINKHIESIGGEKALEAVKTLSVISTGTVQGTPLQLTIKSTNTNKIAVDMSAMGMSVMKQVVNEKGAYMVQQGQRKDLTGDDLKQMQEDAGTFKELRLLTDKEVTLKGIESIKDKDAYAIVSGKSTLYYDVASGLKVAESKEVEQAGQKMTTYTYYDDYKDVKGIKFPYKTTLSVGMDIEFTTSEVKINEGVTDEDFK